MESTLSREDTKMKHFATLYGRRRQLGIPMPYSCINFIVQASSVPMTERSIQETLEAFDREYPEIATYRNGLKNQIKSTEEISNGNY